MTNQEIRQTLQSLAEPKYQKFSSSLLPETKNILGVRLPRLRKIAKELAKGDWRAYLTQAKDDYFEEIMLQGMVLGYVKTDLDELFSFIQTFVSKIDNWSVCDSFCAGLKIAKQYPEQIWNFIQPYLRSEKEFEVRFGVVMILNYFIKEEYLKEIFQILNHINQSGYYCKMAVAWALSMCYISFPQETMIFLKNNHLDEFTYQKTLQKIIESRQISKEEKKIIREMKEKIL
uniref:DNA alkylation repair protein n=1 Tax=uncultured Bacillota bacterium TaxID=344338 RepID=A0A650EMY6_9FIRM|nr:hypothetical protein Firmicute1046_2930 [uncultured Firmicutes bacterium]